MLARIPAPPHLTPPLIQNHHFPSSSLRSAYSPQTRLFLALRRPSRCVVPQAVDASGRRQYDRIPMDTAGAYRLVDRETGETFIVWGGSDDDDSSVPSEKVLSWRPGANDERKVAEFFETPGVNASRPVAEIENKKVASASDSLRSFGRLKAQKVKALIKRSSKNRADNSQVGSEKDAEGIVNHNDSLGGTRRSADLHRDADLNYNSRRKEVKGTDSPEIYSRKDDGALSRDSSFPLSSFKGWGSTTTYLTSTGSQLKRQKNGAADSGFFSRKSFIDIGCSDDMVEALRSLRYLRPSHIQAMAYEPILGGKSCIIADQSGSGKTLAYLAPTIQCLRQEELQGLSKSSSKSPRVIILVPTAELASQVLSNCRSIAKHGVPFRSVIATGGFRQRTQLENLNEESDVLIATPGRFIYLLQEGFLQLTNLRCVVLDEVDILFKDDGFEQVLESLISSAPVVTQYLFATATLPIDIYNKLVEIFPDCEVIMGPGMHRTSSGLEEVLVDCSGADGEEKNPETAFLNKKSALLQLTENTPVPKTIVFCNKIETCRKVENALNRFDRKGTQIKVLPFHSAIAQEMRLANMKEFLTSRSKDSMILICTDRASRGIDFAGVDHVVLFDFPRDPSEYVRRVGRTARGAGGKGKAYVFVVGKQVSLARRIMERNKKGHPLHHLPCTSSNL
ncbi:DEAD-box ATP-dependent RNA helicase 50-like isoform X1 [Zingiber officinale]|uniref:DEAD-box ATP-dependent RNA helicase 50-like isoform X1 n=1 Tax=Zingiber officinale TaxID=94328 RepID=UPI001C4D8EB2|nr:DEAD-box ATP-dependent RNA helicase 50-like isoform X1 [Zingiber officinale]